MIHSLTKLSKLTVMVPLPFSSFSYLFYGNVQSSFVVQQAVVDYIISNWDRFKVFTHDHQGNNYPSREAYKTAMLNPMTYGSVSELQAASEVFSCRFQIFRNGHLFAVFGEHFKTVKNIRFSGKNFNAGHFDAYVFSSVKKPNISLIFVKNLIVLTPLAIFYIMVHSRPLVPLSDNINEYEVLTPGHFIIGRPISAIPEPSILDISDNRLSRWQYTTKCVQTLWKRWKNDYLNHLQQRNKWQFEKNNVAVGCLVLLKENDLPPCKWAMARILEVIYGTD
ncbi:integrase catalytic domain-containing protein, partial [Trichonephila clavipes]